MAVAAEYVADNASYAGRFGGSIPLSPGEPDTVLL